MILKLYRQVLEAKLLRATFEEAFVPYLGVAMLRGLTAAFGAQNLGSVDQGVSFWVSKEHKRSLNVCTNGRVGSEGERPNECECWSDRSS